MNIVITILALVILGFVAAYWIDIVVEIIKTYWMMQL
jgi:hypothetical protein